MSTGKILELQEHKNRNGIPAHALSDFTHVACVKGIQLTLYNIPLVAYVILPR